MARKNTMGGKPPQTGNKVSHSHRKTKRQWMPNVQDRSLYSAVLGRSVRMTLPVCVLRSVDNAGGLDNYLLQTSPDTLGRPIRRLQALIRAGEQAVISAEG